MCRTNTTTNTSFFANITPIVAYAFVGTLVSTFVVGGLVFSLAKMGLTSSVDETNPMESLLFGALISAVDPVATLSIMGSPELQVRYIYILKTSSIQRGS